MTGIVETRLTYPRDMSYDSMDKLLGVLELGFGARDLWDIPETCCFHQHERGFSMAPFTLRRACFAKMFCEE